MGCDDDLVKCLVFWVNFFLALVGISLISVGIIYKITLEEFFYALPKDYQEIVITPILIIPIGTSLIALAVIGCYGSLSEKISFVRVHCVVLFIIFVIQISVGIFAFYEVRDKPDLERKLNQTLNKAFYNYHDYRYKEVIDLVQHRLQCCGINGSSFWREAPKSCHNIETYNVYDSPCLPFVVDYLIQCLHIVGIITIVLSLTELIGSAISLFFISYLRNQSRKFLFIKTYPFENELL